MDNKSDRIEFTKEMKATYKILIPNMLNIHFSILKNALINHGYNVELLQTKNSNIVQEGLKYVHNDTCYPALLVIGQFIDALDSGKYDVNKTALMITQTGGGCRASNYIHLLRKALKKAGYEQVPVISLNLSGMEKNEGFKMTFPLLRQLLAGLIYGDMMMLLNNQIEPYQVEQGATKKVIEKWVEYLSNQFKINKGYNLSAVKKNLRNIAQDFSEIKISKTKKVKVGIVGEIYVKFSELGNNGLEEFLKAQNCEIMVPGLMNFMLFKIDNRLEDIKLYGGSKIKYIFVKMLMKYFLKIEKEFFSVLDEYEQYTKPSKYYHLKELIKDVVGYGNKMGEGWLLTAEMLELVENGYNNIICTQPFGCLPNHIVGKGMIRKVRKINEKANIVPIDYDPSATKVNQENRIKLMLAVAKEELEKECINE